MKLYNGDCLEIMKQIPDKFVDCVVTDPPYLIKGNGFSAPAGKLKNRDIFKNNIKDMRDGFNIEVLSELQRVLKKWNAYFYCNKDLLFELIVWFKNNTSAFLDVLIEHINNPTPFCNTYLNDIDYVLFVRESGVKLNGSYHDKIKVINKNTNKQDKLLYGHPTAKYVNLVERYIKNSTNEGDVVLDPFMGSGTTGVACKNTNRDFIGVELDETYFNIAKGRIENELTEKV